MGKRKTSNYLAKFHVLRHSWIASDSLSPWEESALYYEVAWREVMYRSLCIPSCPLGI